MSILYRNWFVHNMLAHPLHELVYLALRLLMFGKTRARRVSDYIHDVTLPLDDTTPSVVLSGITVVSVPHADEVEAGLEAQRQQCKEEAVLLCLMAGYALIRRGDDEHGFSIHCMNVDGDTFLLSESASYESLWQDAHHAAMSKAGWAAEENLARVRTDLRDEVLAARAEEELIRIKKGLSA